MSQLKYPDPVTPRAGFDPTLPRPVDPDVQRAEVRGDAASRVAREGESSRTDPRPAASLGVDPASDREYRESRSLFSRLDFGALLFAAIMTLGPLAAAALGSMHS